MDFFRVKMFRKPHRAAPEKGLDDEPLPHPEEPNNEKGGGAKNASNKSANDAVAEAEDDDDDFIMDEVKRRLKELRRNSFMVLIPEEDSCGEEEDELEGEGETSSSEWMDVEAEGRRWWGGFDVIYDKYCERMLFFDRMSLQQLNESGCHTPTSSPKPSSKRLASPFRCLSLKKIEEPEDEIEHLQQPQHNPYEDLETAYVAQICLTWEALHCQYTQLCQKISCQPENNTTCYNHSAQMFQQFQVLLQRFIENEPFEQGLRVEVYARARNLLPLLLQAPNIRGSEQKEIEGLEPDSMVLALDLSRVVESSILTFHLFLKMDKKKTSGIRNLLGNQTQIATPLHLVQSSLDKKRMRLKDLCKKSKVQKKKWLPQMYEDIQLLFGLIDMKVLSRVLGMAKITKEQLLWCEEKLKKIDFLDGKLRRDPSPILFPC